MSNGKKSPTFPRHYNPLTVDDNVPLDMAYNIPEYLNIRKFYPGDGGTASSRDVDNYLQIDVE